MQGHIRKRTHTTKSGRQTVRWYVVVDIGRTASGRRRQKWHGGFRTRKEAEAARARIVHEINGGTYIEPSKVTFDQWIETWLPTIKTQVKPSTFDSYRRNLELHVLPRLGRQPLGNITGANLTALYGELLESGKRTGGGLSPKTVRYVHTIVHKALEDAVDSDLVAANAATRAKPPKPRSTSSSELRFWRPEELRRFLELVEGHRLEAAWHVAAMTGMRRGEVLGLRWKDIDLDGNRLSVRQAVVAVAYDVLTSTPKSHQARVIDLDEATVGQLRVHHAGRDGAQVAGSDGSSENDLVFCREDGSPIHPHTFSQAFERLVAKSDLPRIRLHDLRHTHASIALQAGVPVKVISERLGHESPAFTLKQYAHVIPGMQAEAAAVISNAVLG